MFARRKRPMSMRDILSVDCKYSRHTCTPSTLTGLGVDLVLARRVPAEVLDESIHHERRSGAADVVSEDEAAEGGGGGHGDDELQGDE